MIYNTKPKIAKKFLLEMSAGRRHISTKVLFGYRIGEPVRFCMLMKKLGYIGKGHMRGD